MSYTAEEQYALYDERYPRARVTHRCVACKEDIAPGERYARVFVAYDGTGRTIIRCLRCQALHQHLRKVGWNRTIDDPLWPDERLNCGEEYEQHWGMPPPPEVAALAFMTAAEAQAIWGAAPGDLERVQLSMVLLGGSP